MAPKRKRQATVARRSVRTTAAPKTAPTTPQKEASAVKKVKVAGDDKAKPNEDEVALFWPLPRAVPSKKENAGNRKAEPREKKLAGASVAAGKKARPAVDKVKSVGNGATEEPKTIKQGIKHGKVDVAEEEGLPASLPTSPSVLSKTIIMDAWYGKKNTRGQTTNDKLQLSQSVAAHSISQPNINPSPISQPIATVRSISHATTDPAPISRPIDRSHSLDNADLSDSRQCINKKKGRGPALGIPMWGTSERFHVDFDRFGYPTGKCEQPFVSQLGVLARNGFKLPLTYLRWTDIPDDMLDSIWREVQENTDVPPDYRRRCLHSVGSRWREWKHHVKRENYDIYTTDEERLAIVPDRVVIDQWRTLVQYWGQEAVKVISKKNSVNRKNLGRYHKMGRSSFRSVRSEMEKQGNDQVDGIDVFIRTRTDKMGKIDLDAQESIRDMNILLEKVSEEERTVEYRDSCFTRVMGEDGHGCLRTCGLMRKTDRNLQPSRKAVESIRSQLREEMQSQFDVQIAQMKTQMEAQLKAQMEEQMACLHQEMRAHLERVGYPLTPTTPTSRIRVGDENSIHEDAEF